MQTQLYEYLMAHKSSLPEIRFYLDETGGELTYTGIAGICVINWKQFEKYHAALTKWRTDQGWIEPIHFAEISEAKSDRAVALMQQLQKRKAGILFLGYALTSRGRTYSDQFSLFIQLVVDSLKFLRSQGCLRENRCVRVIKESQDGFDQLHLRELTTQLSEVIALEFPGEVTVLPVECWPKGRTVLLECADVIAGGMQRRALYKGWKPKDKLAEAIVNVTGFEDHHDPSVLFKYFAAR